MSKKLYASLKPQITELANKYKGNFTDRAKRIAEELNIPYTDNLRKRVGEWVTPDLDESAHTALEEECETVGIPIDSVNHYWYKGKHFSLHVGKGGVDPIKLFNEYIEEAKETLTSQFDWSSVQLQKQGADSKLLVPAIFDLHLGKLAWGEETGEDYDIKIAANRFRSALEDLIQKTSGHTFSKVLFIVGNDIFNSDRALPFSQTTAGTPQQDDIRFQKMFRMGVSLMTEAVNRLSEIAPVDVVTVISNHDAERVFYLGEVLSAVFANHPNVNIDNTPRVRKYYKFGRVLLGLAHGHNEKPDQLPLLMAQESAKDWSDTWYREWLLGHIHHKKQLLTQGAKDYNGVRVTYLTSPSAPDAWHHSKGFVGAVKGAEAFVYEAEEGLVGTAVHNIK